MKNCLFLFLFIINISVASSQNSEGIKDQTIEVKPDLVSAENRKKLTYQTTLSILGSEFHGVRSNFTFLMGYFYNDKNLINLRYTFQNSSGAPQPTSTVQFPESTRAISIGDRYFFGNSFNVLGSIFWKQHSKFDISTNQTYFFKDYGVGFSIGNEWQWENFTMGFDWIGFNHSLIKVRNTFPSNSFATDQELTMNLFKFYLGYSF